MSFTLVYHYLEQAGKPEGIKHVLKERGLWPEQGLVLEYPNTQNITGCDPKRGYCARHVLEAGKGFS